MPKALERKLKREAREKGLTGERADAYVYGTLRKTGWVPSTQKKKSKSKSKHKATKRGAKAKPKARKRHR